MSLRARSHKYPDNDNRYIDTTYYDEEDEYLDLGFQRLKTIQIRLYPEFTHLKKLFVDHNNLTILPSPKYLPNLEELTCSSNNLTEIPFYPDLTFVNISDNKIIRCNQYDNSMIRFFDCSYNPGFRFDFYLPECKHLYINDCRLDDINLDLVPRINFLDCENNQLTKITGGRTLTEINMQYNNIAVLPEWPVLVRLMADYNHIEVLRTYPKLVTANLAYNKLVRIKDQPSIRKLIVPYNNINDLGLLPELELADFSHNNISKLNISDKIEYISLQFNPLIQINLGSVVLKSIKELQVNYETYKHVYATYYENFDAVSIHTNQERLEQMLKNLASIFDENTINYIFKKIINIKFKDREDSLFKITLKLFWDFFPKNKFNTLEELINTHDFKQLLDNVTKLYYKTVVAIVYFNGYY